jgi:hypothetical protein
MEGVQAGASRRRHPERLRLARQVATTALFAITDAHFHLSFGCVPLLSADDIARRAIISALKQIRAEEVEEDKEEKETGIDTSDGNNAPVAEASVRARPFVFVLNNFDELDDRQAEKWLQWTNEVTASGLAHVVAPTRRAVTPERVQWLQERHRANHKEGEFVAILLRVAKDAVDRSTAEDKAHRVAVRWPIALPSAYW